MGAVVTFNYQMWKARYSEFCSVSEPTALAYFNEAQIYHRNDPLGPVTNPAVQLTLLNMVTAHIAARYAASQNGSPASNLVGRISAASEGSISVSAEMNGSGAPNEAWWNQTKYGADYWLATAPFRSMHYRSRAGRPTNPFFYRR